MDEWVVVVCIQTDRATVSPMQTTTIQWLNLIHLKSNKTTTTKKKNQKKKSENKISKNLIKLFWVFMFLKGIDVFRGQLYMKGEFNKNIHYNYNYN